MSGKNKNGETSPGESRGQPLTAPRGLPEGSLRGQSAHDEPRTSRPPGASSPRARPRFLHRLPRAGAPPPWGAGGRAPAVLARGAGRANR